VSDRPRLQLRFLGVRGSFATPVLGNLGFGGNTACLEVCSGDNDRLLIDAGSGLNTLPGLESAGRFHLLITHFHIDHVIGLPFFAPMFNSASSLAFWSDKAPRVAASSLDVLLSSPYSPALNSVAATRDYRQVDGGSFRHGSLTVHPFPLNHPQGCLGYRIESEGAAIVHASDLEHGDPRLDATLRDYAQNADVLIYDAQYTDEEYHGKKGWGHSTWREATRVAKDARVKHLILFHHDPTHDDATMNEIVTQARRHFENTDAAQEGQTLSL
jgi:phosphoribosyl 1,2-cyclic phosphodiesterase